jgi:hypothetical protein
MADASISGGQNGVLESLIGAQDRAPMPSTVIEARAEGFEETSGKS